MNTFRRYAEVQSADQQQQHQHPTFVKDGHKLRRSFTGNVVVNVPQEHLDFLRALSDRQVYTVLHGLWLGGRVTRCGYEGKLKNCDNNPTTSVGISNISTSSTIASIIIKTSRVANCGTMNAYVGIASFITPPPYRSNRSLYTAASAKAILL